MIRSAPLAPPRVQRASVSRRNPRASRAKPPCQVPLLVGTEQAEGNCGGAPSRVYSRINSFVHRETFPSGEEFQPGADPWSNSGSGLDPDCFFDSIEGKRYPTFPSLIAEQTMLYNLRNIYNRAGWGLTVPLRIMYAVSFEIEHVCRGVVF